MTSMIQGVCENETILIMADEHCPAKGSSVSRKMSTESSEVMINVALK